MSEERSDRTHTTLRARELLLSVINSQVGKEEPDDVAEGIIQSALDAAFRAGYVKAENDILGVSAP